MADEFSATFLLPEGRNDIAAKVRHSIEAEGGRVEPREEIIPLLPIIGGLIAFAAAAKILNDIFVMTDCSMMVDLTAEKPQFETSCEKYGHGKFIVITEKDGERQFETKDMSSIKLEDILRVGMGKDDDADK